MAGCTMICERACSPEADPSVSILSFSFSKRGLLGSDINKMFIRESFNNKRA